ncbi:CBS domain protein [Halopiger aswanensis]|uniref:CBS domain protein n=1 Tax=Halopiger aswanensis TaxID=148449 RepID=A0A3R7ECH0_9EURY|nr:CBS domain protein [Halopiger aswanensis]
MITDGDSPVGIVTDRDLTVRVLAEDADSSGLPAEDVMTDDPQTIDRSEGFYEATNLMADHGIRRLPVCDGDELVGIITADDLTELIADEEHQLADVIRAQRPEY